MEKKKKSNVLAVISFSFTTPIQKQKFNLGKKKKKKEPPPPASLEPWVRRRDPQNHKTKSPPFAGSVVRRWGIIDGNGREPAKSSLRPTKYAHLDPVTVGVFVLFCLVLLSRE